MSKEKQMPLKEYCEGLEALTSDGYAIDAKGLQNWIEEYVNNSIANNVSFLHKFVNEFTDIEIPIEAIQEILDDFNKT